MKQLRLIAFEGGFNLPIWAAQRQGCFDENGVRVNLDFTPNSTFLIASLLDNKSDIALASIDNVIAYQEGQGEAKIADNPDLFAFMVRELILRNGLNESDVKLVRAGGTGNRYRDLMAGKHDGTLLRTPFEILAKERGFNLLATGTKALGSYMGAVGVARRSWARDNEAALIGFMRGYHAALRWLYDPANREIAEALLIANVRDMTPALARQSTDVLLSPRGGLIKDLALDIEGIKTVLALRSKFGEPKKSLTDPSKYIDTSYAEKAFAKRD